MELLDAMLKPPKKEKTFEERLIELVKDDKELHDATVRVLDSIANNNNATAELKRARIKKS